MVYGSSLAVGLLVFGGDGVAPLFLGDVESAVGAVDEGAQAILVSVPCGYAKAHGHTGEDDLELAAQLLAECGHRLEIIVQGEQYKLVAAVADEHMAAVDLVVYGARDLFEYVITLEMPLRIVDRLEMIHIKDRKREFESALIGKRRKCIETFLELEPVIAARECVPHRLFLRLAQLLR